MSKGSEEDIVGTCYVIKFCSGAKESFIHAMGSMMAKKRAKMSADMYGLLSRLANGTLLSNDSDVKEGPLPDKSNFRALKKIPIRCYYWKSSTLDGVIYVSHFTYKDQNKLDKKNITRVQSNWRSYEQGE